MFTIDILKGPTVYAGIIEDNLVYGGILVDLLKISVFIKMKCIFN